MSRVLNTVVELIRLEDKLESPNECGKTRLVMRNKFVVQ